MEVLDMKKLDKAEKKRLSKLAASKVNSKGADIKKSSFREWMSEAEHQKVKFKKLNRGCTTLNTKCDTAPIFYRKLNSVLETDIHHYLTLKN